MSKSSYIIAILDAEARIRKAVRRLLESHGYRVEDFEQENDFLQALSSRSIDGQLLDLHLFKLSGFDMLADIAGRMKTHWNFMDCAKDDQRKLRQKERIIKEYKGAPNK
jgi:FixJ family two-component response regulator